MPSYYSLRQLKFLVLTLAVITRNIIFQTFPWLVLNRSYKTCLALQCVRVVVCSTALFHKSNFTYQN